MGGTNSLFQAGTIIEELASCCPGFAVIVATSIWSITPLVISTNMAKARELFNTHLCQDQSVHLAASILPDTGRHVNLRAMQEGTGYVLDGQVNCVFNAGVSDLYLIFADTVDTLVCGALPTSPRGFVYQIRSGS